MLLTAAQLLYGGGEMDGWCLPGCDGGQCPAERREPGDGEMRERSAGLTEPRRPEGVGRAEAEHRGRRGGEAERRSRGGRRPRRRRAQSGRGRFRWLSLHASVRQYRGWTLWVVSSLDRLGRFFPGPEGMYCFWQNSGWATAPRWVRPCCEALCLSAYHLIINNINDCVDLSFFLSIMLFSLVQFFYTSYTLSEF
jgi:hypothetical protein